MEENKLNCLRLIRSANVGPQTFWKLITQFGDAKSALNAIEKSASLGSKYTLFPIDLAEQELKAHEKNKYHLVAYFEPEFPKTLQELSDYPPVLSVYGNKDCLNIPSLAIVGARNASLNARHFSEHLARDLSKLGWMITSGLARGIDRHAHQGSLDQGTIAVVAGGVDVIYPPEHKDLYHDIANKGAVISEMPLSMHPGASHFPRRNRIISGLSKGIIIIEAALKSGSLITARFGLEQNREIFAVPGSPLDPRCRGSNDLIRQGAILLESIQDIINCLGLPEARERATNLDLKENNSETHNPEIKDLDNLKELLLSECSASASTPIDALLRRYQANEAKVLSTLLELELDGQIRRCENGGVALLRQPHK